MDREQENSLLTGLGLGLGLAGVGAAGFGARSLLKNRAARQRKAAAQSPSGAGGVDMVDLSTMQLPERAKPTRAQAYENAARRSSVDVPVSTPRSAEDPLLSGRGPSLSLPERAKPTRAQAYENAARRPVTDFEFQQYRPSGGSANPGTVTDVITGEIYRRGGDDAYYQQNRNLQTTQRVDRGDMPLSTPRSAATPLLPGRAPTIGGIDLVDLPSARPDRSQSNRPNTLVQVQETTEPLVVQNSIESIDTAQDQMAGRVARTVQRDIDENLATFDVVQDSLEQRGATPVEAARAAANVTEGEPVYTQTDRLVDEGRSYLRAQEIDPNFGNQYEAENRAQAAQVRDRISRAKALQDAGNEILEELKLEGAREQVASNPQAFLRKFNRANPEEVSGTRVVDNARQRRELGAVVGDPLDQPRVTTESVLAGIDEPPDTTMRGRALRGGKIQADGSISYLDDSGQKYYSADTGTKAKLDTGEEYQPLTRVSNELDKLNSAELEALAVDVNNPAASAQQQDLGRMAQEKLRGKAARQLEGGYDLTPEQSRALERARASVDASQAVQKRYADEKRSRPVMPEGPQQDVARSMETMRRGMAVEPSELPPVIDNVQAMYGEGKGERVAAVGAPTVYTGAAREAAGPVLFTGKSKAESVIAGPRLTGQEIKTATGRAYDAVEPGLMSTTVNVAGTPRNRQIAQQVESNAQQFLSDAISGGLTPKTQQTLEVAAPIRASDTPATPATRYPITQSYTPSSVEASQRTGYARYQPGQSEQAPISPFIGEMSGGTRQQSPELAGPLRGDIGRTSSRPTKMSDRSLEPTVSATPIGPLTQSPGLPRVGLAEETPFVQEFNTVQGQQRTERGKNIAYPRMMKLATANRPAGRLMSPLTLPNSATGEVQTISLGAGPLRTYRM